MKTKVKTRVLAFILALLMIVGILPVTAFASSGTDSPAGSVATDIPEDTTIKDNPIYVPLADTEITGFPATFKSVASAAELETALTEGTDAICISNDFVVDRTFYITKDTIVYSEATVTLTRDAAFAGDVFVVGQDKDDNLMEEKVTLSIGGYNAETSGSITFNGNSENMTVTVVGTFVFVCPEAQADLYEGLVVTNCKKLGNARTENAIYGLSNAANIGGPVAIVAASAYMNVYGGTYTDNSVNTQDASIWGGAFYNFGNMSIYRAIIDGNSAVRAGAIYNYRTLYIYSAEITNNTASTAAGAIYLPASTAAKLYLGGNNELVTSSVIFSGNTAATYGGAIYSSGRITAEDTVFEENSAENGGAVYLTGDYIALNATDCFFDSNSATEKGGAIMAAKHNTLEIEHDVSLLDVTFTENTAPIGAALAFSNSSVGDVKGCSFNANVASSYAGAIYVTASTATINESEFINNSSNNAGAFYLSGGASVVMNKVYADGNTATSNAGFLYSGESTLTVYNSTIKNGEANMASAMNLQAGAVTSIYGTSFSGNTCRDTNTGNAAAIFVYTGGTETTIHSCTFTQNTSAGLGGAITASSKSILNLYNITAIDNSADKGGFLYATTTGTTVTASGITVSGNTATTGGPIIWGNSTGAKLNINKDTYIDLDVTGELTDDYWAGAIYNKLTVTEVSTPIPAYTDYSGVVVDGLWSAVIVKTEAELKAALADGAPYIRIMSDIEISETIYVTAATNIFSTASFTVSRADGFTGTLFAVGKNAAGDISGVGTALTLGSATSATPDMLVIEAGEGTAPVITVSSAATVNIYDNVTVSGTTGGVLTIEENATATIAGGKITKNTADNGVIVNNGTLNISGGTISENTATNGGAIYNIGALNITGGTIAANTAANGGAIYNVGTLTTTGGRITANTATAGGAIYMAAGTATLGAEISSNTAENGGAILCADGEIIFDGLEFASNTATRGGALYIDNDLVDLAFINVTFRGNIAENGGAVYITGVDYTVSTAYFIANTATNGGAIYFKDADLSLSGTTFTANEAGNGGAVYALNATVTVSGLTASENRATANGGFLYAQGANVSTSYNTFSKNEADKGAAVYTLDSEYRTVSDSFEYGYACDGGAIYTERSVLTVNGSTFTGNAADYNGGAIALLSSDAYVKNEAAFTANKAANNGGAIAICEANLTVYSAVFNSNTAANGGAITAEAGAQLKVFLSRFVGNAAGKNGGAIYATGDTTVATVQLCDFESNTAGSFGGAIAVCNKAKVNVYDVTAAKNSASRGAVAYIGGAESTLTVLSVTVTANTATYGKFSYGDNKSATLYINREAFTDSENATLNATYWEAALYGTNAAVTVTDTAPEFVEEGNEPVGNMAPVFDISSADELEAALLQGRKYIRIVADFELDRTFSVYYGTTIFSTAPHTLTRAPGFAGDIFLVGETADGTNSMLEKPDARLTLGNPQSTTASLLTFDGNKDNMTVEVVGTLIFVCNGAVADICENVTVQNFYKSNNVRTYDEKYKLSVPLRIGGAVAIISFGALNVYGGYFTNNSTAIEDTSTEEGRTSTRGGVFYNEGNLKIYGGTFEANEGARGAVMYSYGATKIYGGSFIANNATASGGVYYSPSASATQLNIGYNSTTPVIFKDNTAKSYGGAIYAATLNAIVIYGNTTFDGNSASYGGAIYTSSTLTAMNTTFVNNTATTRGGAVLFTRATDTYGARIAHFENTKFIGNTAGDIGGAISAYSQNDEYASGSIVTTDGCEFISNTSDYGGAISVERKSSVTVNNTYFDSNIAEGEAGAIYVASESTVTVNNSTISGGSAKSHGGAVVVRSADLTVNNSTLENNTSDANAGAIYIAYSSSIERNAKVVINGSIFRGNTANNGGAIYATRRSIENDTKVLTVKSTDFAENGASNSGGAIYLTAGVDVTMKDVTFVANTADNGGAIGVNVSTLTVDGAVFTKNETKDSGAAIFTETASQITINNATVARNTAGASGAFIFSTLATVKVYNSTVNNNTATRGAGMYLSTDATTEIYNTDFIANKGSDNGATLFIYTGGTPTVINGCTFEGNRGGGYGNLYISSKSQVDLYNVIAKNNSAEKGGFMYETTTGTVVNAANLTVSGNTSVSGGDTIWGNSKGAVLNLDKAKYADLDVTGALTDEYWTALIEGSLTVNYVTLTVPLAAKFNSTADTVVNTKGKESTSVNDVFDLALNSSDGSINSTYDKFPELDNSSNFMSRGTTVFDNINGGTVTVDTYVYPKYSTAHNMTVGEALMIYQAMLYKQANPNEEVHIDIASYRFSVQTAVNINRESRYFGYTRPLTNANYDEYGFVRVAYLLVSAAKMGIHVNILGHRDAYPIYTSTKLPSDFVSYFESYVNDYCDPAYVAQGTIGDYLKYTFFDWSLSEDGKGGTDMMHTKLCAVSHYLDMNGEVHRNAVWTSSSNLDGIYSAGYNANWKLQTATIVSDHEDIYRISVNYLRLMPQFSNKEGVIEFQNLMNVETTKQIDLILSGKGDTIPEGDRLVYLGSETDSVFEMYFTPFGGDILSWSETYNPYCKYLRELYESEDYIIFTWNAAEYNGNFPLGAQMEQMIIDAFHNNKNPNNKIYANMESFDATTFDDLTVGVDIGFKSINEWPLGAIHNKDLQFSYVKDGQRYYVSLLNSCNMHGGSMYYQSNFALVIKETTCAENSVFSIIADHSTNTNLVTHTFDETRVEEPTATEHGYVYKVCSCCGHNEIIETLHLGGEWIVQKPATPTENGIRYKTCLVCGDIIEAEETAYNGSSIDPETNTGKRFTASTIVPIDVATAPLTLEATVLLGKSVTWRGGVIAGNYTSPDDENAISFEIYTKGRVRLFYITNGIRTDVMFNEDIRGTEPVHIAVTVDGTTASLYVDGVLSETVAIHNPLPVIDNQITVGGDNRNTARQTFQGRIYSVAMFSDVRTESEIQTDMKFVSSTAPDVLYAEYFTGTAEDIDYISGGTAGTTFTDKEITSIELPETTVGTVEIDLMLPTSFADRAGVIFGNYTNGYTDTINLEVMAGGKLRLYYVNAGVKYDYTFTTDIRSDKPINLAITVDGGMAYMYIDGVLVELIVITGTLPTVSGSFGIGGDYRTNNAQYFKGTIYSVSVYNDVRTKAEILSDAIFVDKNSEGLVYTTRLSEAGIDADYGQSFTANTVGGTKCDLGKSPLTFEALLQLDTDHDDRGGVIIGNYTSSEDENAISLEIYTKGRVRLFYINDGVRCDIVFEKDIRGTNAVHVAVTVDENNAYLYVNGNLAQTRALSIPLPEMTSGYHIGGDGRKGNAQYFKGEIYTASIFDSTRSAEQIKSDMFTTAGAEGLLFATEYINSTIKTASDLHGDKVFEIITEPTAESDGLGHLICTTCGKILGVHSIPYNANGVIKNTYTDTNAALKDGEYYIIEDSFDKAPMTFEFLLQLAPGFNDRAGVVLGNYDGTASGRMNIEIYTNGNPRLWYKINGTSYSYIFNVDVRSEERVHLAITIDGLTASLYVNGTLAETITLTAEVPYNGSKFFVATDQRISAQSFKGEIYSVGIFSDIRTPEEIADDIIMVTSDADALLFSKYFVASEGVQVTGPWADKNAVFVGDSITLGTNCDGDTYWQILDESLNLGDVTVMGTSGSPISSTGNTDVEALADMFDTIPEADLITIFMGTEDYGNDTPLGTIDDTDDISFFGALNYIIPALQAKYPGATIVFVTPTHRYGYGINSATGEAHTLDSIANGAGHTLADYVNAIIETAAKYNVPVIDLYSGLDIDPSSEDAREYYMQDGLHPTSAGHREIAEFIEHALGEISADSVE